MNGPSTAADAWRCAMAMHWWPRPPARPHSALTAQVVASAGHTHTSMDQDGRQNGYDLALTAAVSERLSIPVIASGGVGSLEHFYDGLVNGKADAVLAASIFHYRTHTIQEAKAYLRERGVSVRLGPA